MEVEINIYEYLDYKEFLRDAFNAFRSQNSKFSHRYVSRMAGFASSSFFTKILNGTSKVTGRSSFALARVFGLDEFESQYFDHLISFGQAATNEAKNYHFRQLIAKRKAVVKTLEAEQYELYSRWYYVAILEIMEYSPFEGDYRDLVSQLKFPITISQAKNAIVLLGRLGLIKQDANGVYRKTNQCISTGEIWKDVAVSNFQLTLCNLAASAIEYADRRETDFSSLTLSVSEETILHIRKRIAEFRNELLELAVNDTSANCVYQLNFQVFPLARGGKQ